MGDPFNGFIGLVNVTNLKSGGLGSLGSEELEWMGGRRQTSDAQYTDRGVRAHTPIDGVPGVGLGNGGQRAGTSLREEVRFRDGAERHIHQTMQKVEGSVTFHTAMSTAFPQPQPQGGFSGTDEGAGGAIEDPAGNCGCEHRAEPARFGDG